MAETAGVIGLADLLTLAGLAHMSRGGLTVGDPGQPFSSLCYSDWKGKPLHPCLLRQ